jgi:WD40-like Beta Propeller Repeat
MPAGLSWTFTTGAPTGTLSNQVVFVSDRGGIANLWAMNPDGTNQRQLSAELSPVVDYSVAPDGRTFLVADGATIIWQRANGSARRLLTDTGVIEFDPAFSPDGSSITFGRADPVLGGGLGLWTRDADGSDPRPVELPKGAQPTPSAGQAAPQPLLRAPRISPDGTALAFIDGAGRIAILDLKLRQLTTAPFVALSEPTWLPDSGGVLVSGLPIETGFAPIAYQPRSAVALLDPASGNLLPAQLAAVEVVRLDRSSTSVVATTFGAGASRPTLDASGRYAFIRLGGPDATAGSLVLTSSLADPGSEVMRDPAARVSSASFAPEPHAMVIARVPASTGDPALTGGVWVVNLTSGLAQQLSVDGRQPYWLP